MSAALLAWAEGAKLKGLNSKDATMTMLRTLSMPLYFLVLVLIAGVTVVEERAGRAGRGE